MDESASTEVSRLLYGSPLARPRRALAIIAMLIVLLGFTLLMILDSLGTLGVDGLAVFVRRALDLRGRGRGAPEEGCGERGHPFTAPAMMPAMSCRPAPMNSTSSGMVAMTAPVSTIE